MQAPAGREWDVIVVGGGHNGLTCAAYLASSGKTVLVLEAKDRIGGACTLKTVKTSKGDLQVSPCAYLSGLLHPLVVEELQLVKRGYQWILADGGTFVPFADGTSILLSNDSRVLEAEIEKFAGKEELEGWRKWKALIERTREKLRPLNSEKDIWVGEPPSRKEIERRLEGDHDAINMLFNWSMEDMLRKFLKNEKLIEAQIGQGVIGTNASPRQKGTAYINFHHHCATPNGAGSGGDWGYVKGGMGQISLLLAQAAESYGASIRKSTPVASIYPGAGVALHDGTFLRSKVIVSNADAQTTWRLLRGVPDTKEIKRWQKQIEAQSTNSASAKFNLVLSELPKFRTRPNATDVHRAQVTLPLTSAEMHEAWQTARAGKLPKKLWCEVYFQTAVDESVANGTGLHSMSIFSQYLPYSFADGKSWDEHRDEVRELLFDRLRETTLNLPAAIVDLEIMGPPDIEREIGLSGGHIFQGEILPQYMWRNRLSCKTPLRGLYLCGACTHPGGSVMAINGRNCAMKVLDEQFKLKAKI